MQPLALGPLIFWAPPLPQSVQHRLQRGGALRGQAAIQLPRALERGVELNRPAREVLIPVVGVGTRTLAADLPGQRAKITQIRAAGRRAQQEHIRVAAHAGGRAYGGNVTSTARPPPGTGCAVAVAP